MNPQLNRIRYRAWRRGFTEADLIFGPFADQYGPTLTPAQLDEYETLLDQDDHDLYEWVVGRRPTPPAFDGEVMALLRSSIAAVPRPRA